ANICEECPELVAWMGDDEALLEYCLRLEGAETILLRAHVSQFRTDIASQCRGRQVCGGFGLARCSAATGWTECRAPGSRERRDAARSSAGNHIFDPADDAHVTGAAA